MAGGSAAASNGQGSYGVVSGAPSKKVRDVMSKGPESAKYRVRVNRNGRYSHTFKMSHGTSMDKARGVKGYGR